MTLIRGLAGQLCGTININDDNGVVISIEFAMVIPALAIVTAGGVR
jgi:hypothetical protein